MSNPDTAAPFKVSANRILSMRAIVLIAIIGTAVSVTLAWAAVTADIHGIKDDAESTRKRIDSTGERLRVVERSLDKDLAEIKTDLKWIRDAVESDHKVARHTPP